MQLEITYIIITKTFTTSNQRTLSMYYSRAIHYYHESMIQINTSYGTFIGGIPALKQKSDWQQIADILICDIPNVVAFIHNKLW